MGTFVETDCTITMDGRTFESGGAFVTDTHALGYVGEFINRHPNGGKLYDGWRKLTDWHGNQIGRCYIHTSWPIRSAYGSRMCSIRAEIDGACYSGRGFGEGMAVNLRRVKVRRID